MSSGLPQPLLPAAEEAVAVIAGARGSGWAQRGSGPAGYQGNLSDEDLDKLNKQRQAFFEGTRELRKNLHQKRLELRSELAKKDPDAKKAAGLQGEISDLSGRMDPKAG